MKKAILKTFLSVSGVTALRQRRLSPGLYCFNYHRVGDPTTCAYDREVFSCSAQRFAEQVAWIQSHFQLVNLNTLLRLSSDRQMQEKPLALITFDDGYIDCYAVAFPILKKLSASAVFFLPTSFIGTQRMPWWDEVAWILRHSPRKQISPWGSNQPFLLDEDNIERSIRDVLLLAKKRHVPFAEQIHTLAEECRMTSDGLCRTGPLFIDWDQAREMRSAGMDIGSHTHTHPLLSHLAPQGQEKELADSKAILEMELRGTINTVAYPDGGRSAFNADTVAIARRVGYRLGFSFIREVNRLPIAHPFEIGRFAVSENCDVQSLRSMVCFPRWFA